MSVRKGSAQSRVNAKNAAASACGMRLQLGSGDQNGNKVSRGSGKASSPDSTRSSGSFSSSSAESPADVEMVDCCLSKEVISEVFPTGTAPAEPGLVARPESAGKPTSLYLDARPDNWNDNLALVMTSLRDEGHRCGGEGSSRSSDTSPDSAVSEAGGFEPAILSRGGNDRASPASISSGEMVLRKNSFSLTDSGSDNLLSTSFLGESAVPSLAPSKLGASSVVLPDVCEGLREKEHQARVSGDDVDSQRGRVAFFHRSGGEDTHLATGEGPLGLQSEKEGKDAGLIHGERECSSPALLCRTYIESEPLQCSSGACTPVEGGTFLILGSEDSDTSCNAQTSTPVQGSVSNKTFCLSSLSESPFRGDTRSPAGRAQKGRPLASASPSPAAPRTPAISRKPVVPRTPSVSRTPGVSKAPMPSANKQTDAKRFPPPDPKVAKSKIASRPTAPLKAPTPSKPPVPDQNAPTGSPARRRGNAGNRQKRRGSSFTQSSGVAETPRPRRASECEAALRSKPRKDVAVSLQGEAPARSEFNINNVTFNAVPAPSQQNKAGQGAGTLGGAIRPSEGDPGKNGTTVDLCAVNQEVRSASIAAAADGGKSKLGPRPSPGRARGTSSSSQTPTASLRPPPPASKASSSSKDGCTSGSMSASRTKNTPATGNPKMRLTERPSVAAAVAPGAKPASGPGLAGPRPAGVSRLPVKSQDHSEAGAATGSTPASLPAPCKTDAKPARPVAPGGPAARLVGKPPITKAGGVRGVVQSPQRKALTAGIKNTALPNQTPSKTTASPLHRSGSGRLQRQAAVPQVDKNRPRASPRAQPPAPAPGQPDLLPTETKADGTDRYRARCESSNKYLQQLKRLLVSGNRRFEAVAVVIQHLVTEHEEAVKQKQQLAQELLTLRGELVTSATSCEALEREKDELRAAFEGVLQKVQEQHQSDMADLEERLKTFYAAEWEKVHQAYQEEADKCKAQMELQLDDLKSKHEAMRKELEDSHVEKLESLKLHYEMTVEELRKIHKEEMETLDKTLKEAEAKLTEQMEELTAENNTLNEKLKAEEERRRILAEKNQKDSHTLYLEQELESLKVVLDIKNKQLHQQDKKLMQMDKLMEKSVKLDECLKKVQQENEDLKARMDKHAALSRQLSTEQAALQESLQKESKVNKRLSMENEELLWKLHNGDLSSPRKLSPTSPSKSFQSPRNSGVFSSAPVSPR